MAGLVAQSFGDNPGLRSFPFYQEEAKRVLLGAFTHCNSL